MCAHLLLHQAEALAAVGSNPFFSTMDLTSGYYNVEVHKDNKRFTAFNVPFGLNEYNRLPQGLCNSPAKIHEDDDEYIWRSELHEHAL